MSDVLLNKIQSLYFILFIHFILLDCIFVFIGAEETQSIHIIYMHKIPF